MSQFTTAFWSVLPFKSFLLTRLQISALQGVCYILLRMALFSPHCLKMGFREIYIPKLVRELRETKCIFARSSTLEYNQKFWNYWAIVIIVVVEGRKEGRRELGEFYLLSYQYNSLHLENSAFITGLSYNKNITPLSGKYVSLSGQNQGSCSLLLQWEEYISSSYWPKLKEMWRRSKSNP